MRFITNCLIIIVLAQRSWAAGYFLGAKTVANNNGGVIIDEIFSDGIARQCQMHKGDLLYFIDGRAIDAPEQAINVLNELKSLHIMSFILSDMLLMPEPLMFYIQYRKPDNLDVLVCRIERSSLESELSIIPPTTI